MRLEALYRIRFTYPESWMVSLEGGWEQHLFLVAVERMGTVTGGQSGGHIALHVTGGNWRALKSMLGQPLAHRKRRGDRVVFERGHVFGRWRRR